jgi:hypothetical protein
LEALAIYADGSRINGDVGAATIYLATGDELQADTSCIKKSIRFAKELMGILMALNSSVREEPSVIIFGNQVYAPPFSVRNKVLGLGLGLNLRPILLALAVLVGGF